MGGCREAGAPEVTPTVVVCDHVPSCPNPDGRLNVLAAHPPTLRNAAGYGRGGA